MVDKTTTTTKDQSDKPCCRQDGNQQEKKLVKATDLPIHGNPHPPKDCVQTERPGLVESKVRAARTILQPYISPFATAYEKTNDVVSIGLAHSQSTIQRLAENESPIVKTLVISTSTLFGFALARRGGLFKKLLFTSAFFSGAFAASFPNQAVEKAQMLLYIAKNKLPEVAKQQYEKFTGSRNE